MQKITLIIGCEASGKSFLANNLSLFYKNPIYYQGKDFHTDQVFVSSEFDSNTDLILIDDIPKRRMLGLIFDLSDPTTVIYQRGAHIYEMDTPKIIITCEIDKEELLDMGTSFHRRVDIISTHYKEGIFEFKKLNPETTSL